MRPLRIFLSLIFLSAVSCPAALAQQPAKGEQPKLDTSRGDKLLAEYFAAETAKLRDNCLADIKTLDDWKAHRDVYRLQLLEMLGLDPLPEKTDLKPVITGRVEQDEFVVEKLHFQSRPGLYVTGNLYLPKKIEKPLPTILYVCGHSRVLGKDGVPLGAKAGYQHHGAWYARNGYACLTIDTLQLGEIEGIHHGTHRYGMWWWLNRGYTPAGVEAWNCVRALDYLETRPEVDKTRFGVTGRSGGGAYSWWIAAIDERIKCAVPTAGITDLQNHVVDGCVEGHCDCMFMVNTYRWDYPQVAALVAPRPLLIANTDSDGIFPLDGVHRTFDQVRRIYRLYDAEKKGTSANAALAIAAGPHKDTQELQTNEFRWFNHYLKNDDSPIDSRAPKFFEPEQLKVFAKLPEDQINTKIHETFTVKAPQPQVPRDNNAWQEMQTPWRKALLEKSLAAWPHTQESLNLQQVVSIDRDGVHLAVYDFNYPVATRGRLYVLYRAGLAKPELNVLNIVDDQAWKEFLASVRPSFEEQFKEEPLPAADQAGWESMKKMFASFPWAMSYFAPRGVGPTAFDQTEKKQVQNRRRFYLLGQTLDEMQSSDVFQATLAAHRLPEFKEVPLWLRSHRRMAGVALYTCLFQLQGTIQRLDLYDLPKSHRDGPTFLNVERYLDMPQAVAMAAERSKVVIYQDDDTGWEYPQAVAKQLGWDAKQIQIRKKPAEK
jgi:Prolyl oligopeptidase family